jgi:hypothetical protein
MRFSIILTYFPLFRQFIEQQIVWFKNFVLEHLHYHTCSNMFFNGISKAYYVQILSCFSSRVGILFTIWPFFLTFWLVFQVFFHRTSNVTWITSSFNFQVFFNACAHIPLTLWVSTFYVVFIGTNAYEPMLRFMTTLSPLRAMLASMWNKNN